VFNNGKTDNKSTKNIPGGTPRRCPDAAQLILNDRTAQNQKTVIAFFISFL
jgi:hypothetical protein